MFDTKTEVLDVDSLVCKVPPKLDPSNFVCVFDGEDGTGQLQVCIQLHDEHNEVPKFHLVLATGPDSGQVATWNEQVYCSPGQSFGWASQKPDQQSYRALSQHAHLTRLLIQSLF
jgi:hypothetical protein